MGFSTFGSKPHLAKKRKRNDDPSAERTGSNSLPLGSERRAGVRLDVDVDPHLGPDEEDGDQRFIEAGEEDADEVENLSIGHEDISKEAGKENTVVGTGWSAQTSTWGSGRLMRLSERETLQVSPANIPPRTAVHNMADSSQHNTTAILTTKVTTMTRLGNSSNFAALRHGVRDQDGDVTYYDHSFVEDPWKGLR